MKLSDKAKGYIRLSYSILVTVLLIVLGVLFAYNCYTIYRSGPSPFTRESIGTAFDKVAPLTYVTLALVIVGLVLELFIPTKKEKLVGAKSLGAMVGRLSRRVDNASIDSDLRSKIEKERSVRSILSNVRVVLATASAILPLFYLLNPNNFPAVSGEYNSEILHGMLLYLVFLAPLAIFEVVYVILKDASLNREYLLLKESASASGIKTPVDGEPLTRLARIKTFFTENEKPVVLGVRIALLGCAAVFIIVGIVNGGMADVLGKAIKICTECIGLG